MTDYTDRRRAEALARYGHHPTHHTPAQPCPNCGAHFPEGSGQCQTCGSRRDHWTDYVKADPGDEGES